MIVDDRRQSAIGCQNSLSVRGFRCSIENLSPTKLLERLQSTGRGSELKWCGHFQHTLFTSDSRDHKQVVCTVWNVLRHELSADREMSVSPCMPVVCVLTPVVLLAKKPALKIAQTLCDTALVFSGSLLIYMSDCKYFYIVGKKMNS